ncbi:hypothetical protein PMPD1_2946 [Paramixta manurensis]|uniref:DUF7480 domain-containing protein n=2 Tax=Paramixta manurensis TaxID=2740817 RepID=A0A6M8UG39_9GAMM|nr:hypothetical protein PMPD1_2946 [Erwiniaceae bacterium PD-1]
MLKLLREPLKVAVGACLPTLNYDFKPTHTYTAYFAVAKNETERARYFSAEFSLDENGIQQLNQ